MCIHVGLDFTQLTRAHEHVVAAVLLLNLQFMVGKIYLDNRRDWVRVSGQSTFRFPSPGNQLKFEFYVQNKETLSPITPLEPKSITRKTLLSPKPNTAAQFGS